MAAEAVEQVECFDASFWLANLMKEILGNQKLPKIQCYTDSHQLYDAIHSIRPIKDKRLRIDLAIAKEMLDKHEISKVNWIPKEEQLADCLTKSNASATTLIQVLNLASKLDI